MYVVVVGTSNHKKFALLERLRFEFKGVNGFEVLEIRGKLLNI
jgi:hypothetical protein